MFLCYRWTKWWGQNMRLGSLPLEIIHYIVGLLCPPSTCLPPDLVSSECPPFLESLTSCSLYRQISNTLSFSVTLFWTFYPIYSWSSLDPNGLICKDMSFSAWVRECPRAYAFWSLKRSLHFLHWIKRWNGTATPEVFRTALVYILVCILFDI